MSEQTELSQSMSEMAFLSHLKEYLTAHHQIHTVRHYLYSSSIVRVEGVGTCRRVYLGLLDGKKDLQQYVDSSGFATTDDWWRQIKKFIRTPGPYHLYRVEVIDCMKREETKCPH